MPRARTVAEDASAIRDEVIPGLEQDPAPVRRGPGRPPGTKNTPKPANPKIKMRNSSGQVMSKAQLKAKVATEIYGFASMFVGLLGMKDACADVFLEEARMPDGSTQERLAAIVGKTVDILARNDNVLSAMATTGLIGELSMLGALLAPVVKQVWAAHGPGGHGHREELGDVGEYAHRYPAPSLA